MDRGSKQKSSQSKSNPCGRQRQPRRAAASAAASRNAATSDSSNISNPFQSPRKRLAVVSAEKRKKSRSEAELTVKASGASKASSNVQPNDSSSNDHRYPLRSRASKSTEEVIMPTNTKRGGYERSGSVGSENSALRLPPQVITPASGAPARQLTFGDDGNAPSLFGNGTSTCQCPKHCIHRELVAFEYLKHYGENVLRYIKDREAQEYTALPSLSTRRQGIHHESSSISSPVSTKSGSDDDSGPTSPSSKDSASAASRPTTPRPETVISTRQRVRLGDKSMRFLEEPTDLLERQPYVTQRMRAVLVSWLVEVSIEYNVSSAAYHLAISLLDRVLDCGPTVREREGWSGWDDVEGDRYLSDDYDEPEWPSHWFVVVRKDFQALGCTCLWLASKLEDRDPPLMDDFFFISDQSVTTFALRNMERRVCKVLGFRLQRVTPFHFLPTFLRASRQCHDTACVFQSPVQHNMVLYLITLGRLSCALSRYAPSVLAAAAVYLARATLDMEESNNGKEHGKYWSSSLAHYTGYSKDDLKNPVFLLYHYQLKAEEMNVAVYHQFSKSKYDSVSVRTVRRVEELGYESHVPHDFLNVEV